MLSQVNDSIALIEAASGIEWTYRQLGEEIERRQDRLKAAAKSLLFLFCRNDLNSVAWYLAALESGHTIALLSDQLDAGLRSKLIASYRPDWIDGEWQENLAAEAQIHPDTALLLSTSGSTGSPKFVRLTKANVFANAEAIRESLAITPDHFPVAHLPIHYSYGLSVLNSHLLASARVLLTNAGVVTAEFWEALRKYAVNSFSGVPYTYQMIRRLKLDRLNVPSIRIMTQAGGKLDPAHIQHFHESMAARGGSFWVMYGQTEATARISILPSHELPRKLGTAGRTIPGGRISISGDELIYHGPNVMLGYALNRADLAKGDELGGCLHTGDRASLDDEGYVTILGRAKRDAKIFGLRVNLDELESFIRPSGPAAAVAGGKGVVIFCEFGEAGEHGRICEMLSKQLNIHRSAFEFRRIDALPAKASGKIDYEGLQLLL